MTVPPGLDGHVSTEPACGNTRKSEERLGSGVFSAH